MEEREEMKKEEEEEKKNERIVERWREETQGIIRKVTDMAILLKENALKDSEKDAIWSSILKEYCQVSSKFPFITLLSPAQPSSRLLQDAGQAIQAVATSYNLHVTTQPHTTTLSTGNLIEIPGSGKNIVSTYPNVSAPVVGPGGVSAGPKGRSGPQGCVLPPQVSAGPRGGGGSAGERSRCVTRNPSVAAAAGGSKGCSSPPPTPTEALRQGGATGEEGGAGEMEEVLASPVNSHQSLKTVGPLEKVKLWQASLVNPDALSPTSPSSDSPSSSLSHAPSLLSLASSHSFTPDTLPTPAPPQTPREREKTPNSHHLCTNRQFLGSWSNGATPRFSPHPTPRTPSRATPRTPWGRIGHPTQPIHPRDADSGCPGSDHSMKFSQNASLEPIDFLPYSQPSHSLPQPLTASHSASQPPGGLETTAQSSTAHQSLPQRSETAHSRTVRQNEHTRKITRTNTASSVTEPPHSIPQQPEGQHSITDSPDALTAPQQGEDEILSLAFAENLVNSSGVNDSPQRKTADTQGVVRPEQQATASPDPVEAVREPRQPRGRERSEKRAMDSRNANLKGSFKTRYLTPTSTATTAATATGGGSVSSSDIYQSISRLRRDFSIIQDQILGTGRERKKIRRQRSRGRRNADTQTHTHTKRKPLRALDLSCDSGNSDRSVTNPACDPRTLDTRRKGERSEVAREENVGVDNMDFSRVSSSSSSPRYRSPQPCRSTTQAAAQPRDAVPKSDAVVQGGEQSFPNSLVIYIQNFNPPCEDSDHRHHHHHRHSRCSQRRRTKSHDLSLTLDLTTQLARTVLRRSESLLTSLSQAGKSSPKNSPAVDGLRR